MKNVRDYMSQAPLTGTPDTRRTMLHGITYYYDILHRQREGRQVGRAHTHTHIPSNDNKLNLLLRAKDPVISVRLEFLNGLLGSGTNKAPYFRC